MAKDYTILIGEDGINLVLSKIASITERGI